MPKYADPAVFPVTAPAATDNVMTRTAAGTDGNFALGNLAGLAPLAVAADQSAYFTGTVWAPYTVTSVGRTLLAATTQAAQRTAIQAVGLSGDEDIAGIKNFTQTATFANFIRLTTTGRRMEWGDGTNTWGAMRASNTSVFTISAGQSGTPGQIYLRPNGDTVTTAQSIIDTASMRIGTILRPVTDNSVSLGEAAGRWTTVYAVNATINTSDARLKTEPRQLRDAEFKAFSAICRLPSVWRWLRRVHGDENCEPEGRAARKHFGPTVQAAMEVFADHGLDAFENAPFCYDEWKAEPEVWEEWPEEVNDVGEVVREAGRQMVSPARESGSSYSFRKEELLCGMASALAREIDEKDAEITDLRSILSDLVARVAALEAGRTP